jgi:hypothetical protein
MMEMLMDGALSIKTAKHKYTSADVTAHNNQSN